MVQTLHDNETVDYELYPLVTGAERFAAFEDIRKTFTHERAHQLLAELEDIKSEFDRHLPDIS